MIVLSSSASMPTKSLPAASSSQTAKEKPQQGEVIAVGPGGRDEAGKLVPIDVKVGDRVLFGKWSGTEVKLDGVEYPPPDPPRLSRVRQARNARDIRTSDLV
jgi:co-chaperonin GroES (HSP10)